MKLNIGVAATFIPEFKHHTSLLFSRIKKRNPLQDFSLSGLKLFSVSSDSGLPEPDIWRQVFNVSSLPLLLCVTTSGRAHGMAVWVCCPLRQPLILINLENIENNPCFTNTIKMVGAGFEPTASRV